MLTIDMATMSEATSGFATAIPPTALVTETAGVNTPSANVRLVPNSDLGVVSDGVENADQ